MNLKGIKAMAHAFIPFFLSVEKSVNRLSLRAYHPRVSMISLILSSAFFSTKIIFLAWAF